MNRRTMEIHDVPAELREYVRRFAVHQQRLAFFRRIGLSLSVVGLLVIGICLCDRIWRFSSDVRFTLLVCLGAVLFLLLFKPVTDLWRRIDYLKAAEEVERRTPVFGQRLVTLISQYDAPVEGRGSPEFLEQLSEEVKAEMPRGRAGRLLPWTRVMGAWFLVMLVVGVGAIAWHAPWLDFPRLLVRLTEPLGSAPPVTMTRIVTMPAGARVVQGEAVIIKAVVDPIEVGEVMFSMGSAEERTAIPMERTGAGVYSIRTPTVEQSFNYCISAGDAVSPEYAVTMLQKPNVSDLRVRYVYPDYTRRAPLETTCRDGLVEAPIGTRATVQVVSTLPLRSGMLISPEGRTELHRTADSRVVEAELAMNGDQAYQIELTSDQGVTARAATVRVLVRPVKDRPPLVRLVQPVDDLRIDPHAVLPVWYQALDDIGVVALTAHISVNNSKPRDIAIPIIGDGRQIDATYDLDLAPLDLKVGDLLSLSVTVADGLNQTAASEERHVLITPRTISIATYQRISALKHGVQAATLLTSELAEAIRAKRQSVFNREMAAATDAEGNLRQSILAALARSESASLSTTLENFSDAMTMCGNKINLAAAQGRTGTGTHLELDAALRVAGDLKAQLAILSRGQQAMATLADRSNLRSAATLPTTQSTLARVRQTLDRARADVTAAAASLGLDPNAPDLDAKLQQLVDDAAEMIRTQIPVDYSSAAKAWAKNLGTGLQIPGGFSNRLDAAAAAEAARADSNSERVGDLQLAARAVRATEDAFASTTSATRPAAIDAREQLPGAIASLELSYHIVAAPHHPVAALDARARLRRFAGEGELLLAAAEAITRQEASSGHDPAAMPVVQMDPGDAASAAIREVQDTLAGMPGDLARLLQAADASRLAQIRATSLKHDATTAPSERQSTAQRLAVQAEAVRNGAQETLSSVAQGLAPSAADSLSLRLQQVSPETARAADAIDARLSPALHVLQQAVASSDPASLDAAANLTRQAIGRVQADLRRAQSNLADRDPVPAAKLFGRPDGFAPLTLNDPNVVPGLIIARPPESLRGTEPAGYTEALDAYFQQLSHISGTTTRSKTD